MKRTSIFLILLLFLFSTSGFIGPGPKNTPDKIKWYTFQEAIELGKKKPKKIYIDVYTQWCGWCKRMDATTFTDPVISKLMNKYFYAVKLDAEMKDTVFFNNHTFVNPTPNAPRSVHQLASSLFNNEQMSFPTSFYLDENFNLLTKVSSYLSPTQIEPMIKFFGEDAFKTSKWEDYIKTFKGEAVDPAPVAPPAMPH